ncbi:MAG: DNA topoisomerase IV subunit A [Erysipelotrichaceae bacterium]|nr:DNA topoisomerase IV subunit A [Erysipelotrichaceae bacterium]
MAKKEVKTFQEKFLEYKLEDLMGERFGEYSKYIIQDRALPDARDGLKPVQRRILYGMMVSGNTHNKPYLKSARTVGDVMGKYHPHGDSSIYDALVRMSQWWKMRIPLIDMQGNNGSIDNDSAAAMRYTEARLAKISAELMRDIDCETVPFTLTYDDSHLEPTVMPARFPNLLVNGSKGIAAGYATEIPPHNLEEVIDALVYRIKAPNSSLDEIMQFVKGPDFPTGAIVQGKSGIKECFEKGKGKVVIRSRTHFENADGVKRIVVTEIPYEVVKSDLVRAIDQIRFEQKVHGIVEVRDESDRQGLRIAIDLKKECDENQILNYLMKHTDLQINYNYNMVVIDNKKPIQAGLLTLLDSYIAHQKDVVTKKTRFDLKKAKERLHIVEGLIIAINNLDEVIKLIRSSHDKAECKTKLQQRFALSERQSDAIVSLQLYRLSSTDVEQLIKEKNDLSNLVVELQSILDDEKKLKRIIISDLGEIRKNYPSPRLSSIEDEVTEIVIDKLAMITKEDVYVSITRKGYVKRSSVKSYDASEGALPGHRDEDMVLYVGKLNTKDNILLFTNKGNYAQVLVHDLKETKWRDEGTHISSLVNIAGDEVIVSAIGVKEFKKGINIVLVTKNGVIKKTPLEDFKLARTNKPVKCVKVGEQDALVKASYSDGNSEIIIGTVTGKALRYYENEVSNIGIRSAGVKALGSIKKELAVASMCVLRNKEEPNLVVFTKEGASKYILLRNIPVTFRTSSKPTPVYKCFKSDQHDLLSFVKETESKTTYILSNSGRVFDYEYDDKSTPLDKIIKANLGLTKGEAIKDVTNLELEIISSKTPVYEEKALDAKKEEIEKEKDAELGYKTVSLEDLFGEFK